MNDRCKSSDFEPRSTQWVNVQISHWLDRDFYGELDLSQSSIDESHLEAALHTLAREGAAGRVRCLNLFSTKVEAIPKLMRETLPNLERLLLGCTPLVTVPPCALPLGLVELDLGYGDTLQCLPDEVFSELKQMKLLYLGRNRLDSLPESLFDRETGCGASLVRLDLHGNALKSLPPAIGSCSALVELNLGRNQLRTLPAELASCRNLRVLHVYENDLHAPFPEVFLDAFPQLEQLNWRGNAALPRIPTEVEHRGPRALLNYLVRA
ncbi:hypothetical protein CCYA_CCYA16G4103 [Cyanidiococcus yangmingshanensis]|nr:hypothetical protein CCYA_CCYA16G4103 [Cyanidiococcus yangmingshanensis]